MVTIISGDITEYSDFLQLSDYPKFDGVFHLAAKKSVSDSVANPKLYEKVNVLGTQNLLDYCIQNNIANIVYTSSAAVYGQCDLNPIISETNPIEPMNPYGVTKRQGEILLEAAVNSAGISGFSLRVFNIVGASKPSLYDNKGENVIPVMLRSLLQNITFTVFGNNLDTRDGTSIRHYVHVSDVARAHVNAMECLHKSPRGNYEIANVCSGSGVSMLEPVNALNSLSDVKLTWQYGEKRLGDPVSVIGSNQLSDKILGWKPEKDIIQSMKESLDAVLG